MTDFARRDARGDFLKSDTWFEAAVDCPGHEPAPDAFIIVKDYQISFDTLAPDTVRAKVTYLTLGSVEGGTRVRLDSGPHVRTLVAIRGPYQWRIQSPALDQHVLLSATVALAWLPDSLRARLLKLASGRGA